MKVCYGLEMSEPKDKLPGAIAQMMKKTNEVATIIDRDQQLAIVGSEVEATALAKFYDEQDVLEEEFDLYLLETPDLRDTFSDYGFLSDSECSYLYRETTIAFMITEGAEEQVKMALLQIEEDLIAIDRHERTIYFVDRQFKQLIEGYADAYHISVEFLT